MVVDEFHRLRLLAEGSGQIGVDRFEGARSTRRDQFPVVVVNISRCKVLVLDGTVAVFCAADGARMPKLCLAGLHQEVLRDRPVSEVSISVVPGQGASAL